MLKPLGKEYTDLFLEEAKEKKIPLHSIKEYARKETEITIRLSDYSQYGNSEKYIGRGAKENIEIKVWFVDTFQLIYKHQKAWLGVFDKQAMNGRDWVFLRRDGFHRKLPIQERYTSHGEKKYLEGISLSTFYFGKDLRLGSRKDGDDYNLSRDNLTTAKKRKGSPEETAEKMNEEFLDFLYREYSRII